MEVRQKQIKAFKNFAVPLPPASYSYGYKLTYCTWDMYLSLHSKVLFSMVAPLWNKKVINLIIRQDIKNAVWCRRFDSWSCTISVTISSSFTVIYCKNWLMCSTEHLLVVWEKNSQMMSFFTCCINCLCRHNDCGEVPCFLYKLFYMKSLLLG